MTYVTFHNFLDPDTDSLVRALANNESRYGPATVIGDPSWRSGRVAEIEFYSESRPIIDAILRVIPQVCSALQLDIFHPSRCEVQLSSYGNSQGFRQHMDNASTDAAQRVLSWVIYLDLEKPRRWTGGELSFDDMVITPEDGMAIFFPSGTMHAVNPVTAPDKWLARRHTVNGWVRR